MTSLATSKQVHSRARIENILLTILFVPFFFSHLNRVLSGDISAALYVVQEATIIFLILSRNEPSEKVPILSLPSIVAWAATFASLLFSSQIQITGIWYSIGSAMQIIGTFLSIIALLGLGRSFGISAANRGIRQHGAYRIVRHPIYASYMLSLLGVVIAHLSLFNVVLWCFQLSLQCGRIYFEERLLLHSPTYEQYKQSTPYRLLPGIW